MGVYYVIFRLYSHKNHVDVPLILFPSVQPLAEWSKVLVDS